MQLIVTSLSLDLHMCPPLVVKPPVKKAKLFGLLNFLIAIFLEQNLIYFGGSFEKLLARIVTFSATSNFLLTIILPLDTCASGEMLWSISSCFPLGTGYKLANVLLEIVGVLSGVIVHNVRFGSSKECLKRLTWIPLGEPYYYQELEKIRMPKTWDKLLYKNFTGNSTGQKLVN